MKESPVLFNSDMVRAILEGRKTETRRIMKPQPKCTDRWCNWGDEWATADASENFEVVDEWRCPYGKIGDRLWVKETICIYPDGNGNPVCVYKATDKKPDTDLWTPSIFMLRTASRITLKITKIKVEHLQDIDNDGALAEGIEQFFIDLDEDAYYDIPIGKNKSIKSDSPVEAYANLWDSIYKNWNDNPWVWVIKFKRVV